LKSSSAKTNYAGLAGADLIVNVNLRDFTSIDYPKAETIINKGAEAAQAKQQILSPYTVNDEAWRNICKRATRESNQTCGPGIVKVEGRTRTRQSIWRNFWHRSRQAIDDASWTNG